MKIPKGTFVPIASVPNMRDSEVIVVCTGSQGEPNSALQRMASGDHKHVKLKEQDTVVLSSTPIPESGNDALIGRMVDDLMRKGVHVFRHETYQIDGCGPLHVSGHASIEEYRDMIQMLQPKFFIPIYGSFRSKKRHIDIALEEGIPRAHTVNADNGDIIALTTDKMEIIGEIPTGTTLVDQTGALVNSVVVKDRLLLAEEGLVTVILTIDKKTGQLMTSPDIISRGFIYMRDNEELMNLFRTELKRAVMQRYKRIDLDRFKAELKDYVTHFLYEQTQRSPIVIPVVNIIGGSGTSKPNSNSNSTNGNAPVPLEKTSEQIAAEQQDRFAAMRKALLGQDARVD
jgi:ribonuclease J